MWKRKRLKNNRFYISVSNSVFTNLGDKQKMVTQAIGIDALMLPLCNKSGFA